jgi:arylsulfatase A-like enzyme
VDQPTAALLKDLKRLGMLEDTLVVFLTEFGRTVFSQGKIDTPGMGRDHHGRCFTVWLAGADPSKLETIANPINLLSAGKRMGAIKREITHERS